MQLSPRWYHWIIRPIWFTKKYIHSPINSHFELINKSILDFGCGTGANCSICHPDYYLGIDPDQERVHLASSIYPEYKFERFDMERIPSLDHVFDYVIIVAVLHHIPNHLVSKYIEEFQRVLKPDGELIVIEPYLCDKKPLNNRFMNWYDNGEFIRKEEDYMQLFRSLGYECQLLKKFTKCYMYNELFFCAKPQRIEKQPETISAFMIPENIEANHQDYV